MASESSPRPCRLASYEDLFLRLRDAAALISPEDFTVLDCNNACEELLGEGQEALLGRSLLEWIPEGLRPQFEQTLRIARRRYHPREWECAVVHGRDGRPTDVRISACVLKLRSGSEALQLVFRDITRELESKRTIATYIGQLEVLNRKLEQLSLHDEMTGLANFRHFKNQLHAEHQRCMRYNGLYSIVFLDVDHFKRYNDRNGHPAGDELLRQLGALIRDCCRETDLPARYGGEEFAVLCPEVGWKSALVLAERIHAQVRARSFPFGEHQPLGHLSVSVGVAGYPDDGRRAEEVLEAADKAVYHAKASGRDRVVAFDGIRRP